MNAKASILILFVVGLLGAARAAEKELPSELDADRKPVTRTGGTVLLRNGNLLPAVGEPIPGGSILIRDGRIVAVGRDVAAPDGVKVIDLGGKWVIPGIIDCHSHMAISGGVNEGTVSISADVRIRDVIDPTDLTIYRALAGGTTSAHLLHGSANAIGGQDAVIKLKWGRTADELAFPGAPRGIKFALGENPKRSNSRGLTEGPGRFPGTRMGVEATIRRGFLEAREYIKEWEEYGRRSASGAAGPAPRRDLRLETLAGILKGEVRVHSHCYRADEILMLLDLAKEFGFRVATFQHVLEGYKVAPEIAAAGSGASTFSDWWAFKVEAYDAIPYNAALMKDAGVCVSLNSDSGELVRRLYLEASKAVKYGGVPEMEALRMVTLNAAKQLGIDGRVGSLEPGKDADLAVFSEHPFSVYTRCELTLVDGEVEFERRDAWKDFDPAPPPAREPEPVGANLRPQQYRTGAEPSASGPVIAIRGGTVVPVSRPPIQNGTVLLSGSRIVAVGSDVTVPPDARVVDASGLFVYPGMIDPETTLGVNEIGSVQSTLDASEMGNIQPDLRINLAVNPASEHIPVARVNGITSAVVAPQGGLIPGQASLMAMDGWTWKEMTIRDSSALYVSYPGGRRGRARFGGGQRPGREQPGVTPGAPGTPPGTTPGRRGQRPPEEEAADEEEVACCESDDRSGMFLQDEAPAQAPAAPGAAGGGSGAESAELKQLRETFEKALAYGRVRDEAKARGVRGPDYDPRLEALVPFARGERPIVLTVSDARSIREAVAFGEKMKWKVILSGCAEGWKVAKLLADKKVPCLVGPVLAAPRQQHDPYDAAFHNAAVLWKAGVKFAFRTSDSSNVRNLPYHAGMAAAYGLPREEALRAVTLSPAEILGVAGEVGSLDAGKRADVVVADGDLLEIRTHVKHLFIGGREVPLDTKHTRLYETYKKRLAAPAPSPASAVPSAPTGAPPSGSGSER